MTLSANVTIGNFDRKIEGKMRVKSFLFFGWLVEKYNQSNGLEVRHPLRLQKISSLWTESRPQT